MKKVKVPEVDKIAEKEAIEAEEEEELEAELDGLEEAEKGPQKRICVSVGKSLLKKIDNGAEEEDRSRSGYIARKLRAIHR